MRAFWYRRFATLVILRCVRRHRSPFGITTDKNPDYSPAIAELKRSDQFPPELEH